MLRSIIVALDGSTWNETATTLALDWGGRVDARLIATVLADLGDPVGHIRREAQRCTRPEGRDLFGTVVTRRRAG